MVKIWIFNLYICVTWGIDKNLTPFGNHLTVTDCFGKGLVPKNRSDVVVDFDLLEIIQELKKKFQEE